MPDPTAIPTTADLDGNETSLQPVDLGGNDITDFPCGSPILIDLNNYVEKADVEAAGVLAIMSGSLNAIESKKIVAEGELANASTIFTTFQSSVSTINNDALSTLSSILSDQNTASSAAITASTQIKNMLSGISFADTTAEELTLLIELAQTKLTEAEAHLATTLSYKNDLYAEVANIEAAVDAEAISSKAAIDNCVALAQTAKAAAETEKENIDYRFIEIEILYGHAHGNVWYSATDGDGCFTSPPTHTQDLSTEWDQAVEYVVDAGNLIE